MKKIVLIFACIFSFILIYSQGNDTIYKSYNNIKDLKEQISNEEIKLLKYNDITYGFEVIIPNWLNLRDSGSDNMFGGTLPAVEGIENAIMIISYPKSKFSSFDNFKDFVIEKDKFGQPTQMSPNHIFMGKKTLNDVENIGPAYIQYHMWGRNIYDCQFVLTQSETAYILIMFTATRETYSKNIDKFNEFLKGFQITKK